MRSKGVGFRTKSESFFFAGTGFMDGGVTMAWNKASPFFHPLFLASPFLFGLSLPDEYSGYVTPRMVLTATRRLIRSLHSRVIRPLLDHLPHWFDALLRHLPQEGVGQLSLNVQFFLLEQQFQALPKRRV